MPPVEKLANGVVCLFIEPDFSYYSIRNPGMLHCNVSA